MNHGQDKAGSWLSVLGWAAYLACSWTWCIGMFLPVLLVRDYGMWGFVVFAVPNCLGAAAMGSLLRRPGMSEAMQRSHSAALRWFSTVTIAFQVFFVLWMVRSQAVDHAWAGAGDSVGRSSLIAYMGAAALLVVTATSAVLGRRQGPVFLVANLLVWLASLGAMITTAKNLGLPGADTDSANLGRLAALAPVCVFGFVLCPYLDLTFHRARQATKERAGALAFVIGFGALFLTLILFTLGYARLFLPSGDLDAGVRAMQRPAAIFVGYLLLQLFFTIGAHLFAWIDASRPSGRTSPQSLGATVAHVSVVLGVPFVAHVAAESIGNYHGVSGIELMYRIFMSAYGLAFPAYVWICMTPSWRRPERPARRTCRVWLLACVAAAPFFWFGFIERREIWLLPGLVVVILARLLIPRPPATRGPGSGEPPEPSGAPVPVPAGPPSLSAHATPERDSPERPDSP